MDPLEDRRPLDADDRPIIEVEDDSDDELVDEPGGTDLPLEADVADVLDQRATVRIDDDERPG
jgi:hypothetical protein